MQQPATELPTVAVLTMARDEGRMLRRWVDHYASHVGVRNLLVLDDNSGDGSTDDLPCTVHHLPPLRSFERTRMELANGIARGLLSCYDAVVFTDVDEFLVPDPAVHAGLREFLAARPGVEVLGSTALNVIHDARGEGPLDPCRPVLGQRRYAKFVPRMCKPSIKRVPATWRDASHGVNARYAADPELFMIHLKFADRDALRDIAEKRRLMVEHDGRGSASSWPTSGDDLVTMLDEWVEGADPATVPEFDPRAVDLAAAVSETEQGSWKAALPVQLKAMAQQPLVRVPDRLHGLV